MIDGMNDTNNYTVCIDLQKRIPNDRRNWNYYINDLFIFCNNSFLNCMETNVSLNHT